MEKLKIIFLEEGESTKTDSFSFDAKEIAEWIKKVLDDSPNTSIFTFKSNKDSDLLRIIQECVPDACVKFFEENDLGDSLQKDTGKIICAVLCIDGKILGTPITTGAPIPGDYFSLYAKARILAEHINNL